MTWTALKSRGEILRDVSAAADQRRDGTLPLDVDGAREAFRDELDLVGALQLRWHTRLSGRIERELVQQPLDLEQAVIVAWPRSCPASGPSWTTTASTPSTTRWRRRWPSPPARSARGWP
jgi:hypothetical protein